MTEWYVNGLLGLQQGFTLEAAPGERYGGVLTLALALSGDLQPTVDKGATGLRLSDAEGGAVLRYRGLMAYDAAGRALRAWLETDGGSLLLRVDDRGAEYLMVVDRAFPISRGEVPW